MRDTTSRFNVSFSIPASWTRKPLWIWPWNLGTQIAILKVPYLHMQGFPNKQLFPESRTAGTRCVVRTEQEAANTLQPRFWLHFYYYIPAPATASLSAAQLVWAVATQGGHFSLSAISEGWWTPLEPVLVTRNYPGTRNMSLPVCARFGPQAQICKGNQDPARSQAVPEPWRGIPNTWLAPLQLVWLYLYKEGLAKFPSVHVYCCRAPGNANGR